MNSKIGNIITNSDNIQQYHLFNVVNDISKIDNSLPTLIIGYEYAKLNIPQFSILNKSYQNGMLQWTFSKHERRNEHIKDIDKFKEYCLWLNVKNVIYQYIDIINYNFTNIKKLITYLQSDDYKEFFITKNANFLFIYSKKYKIVWGLSLSLCEYIGIKKWKIIDKIKANPHNHIIDNISIISEDIRKKIGNNTHHLLPMYHYFK